ncbi:MAG: S9 family peptidase [Planctomycetota bacterium]
MLLTSKPVVSLVAVAGVATLITVIAGCATPVAVVARPGANGDKATPGWTPAMQMEVRRVSQPMISPSGQRVAFAVAHADLEIDRWVRRIYWAPADGSGAATPVGCDGCSDAQWGADDTTLYVRAPDGERGERVHALDLGTGSLRPVTPAHEQVGWYEPSPDGAWLAYTTPEPTSGQEPRWRLKAVALADASIAAWDNPGSAAGFSWSPTGDRIVAVYQPDPTDDWRQPDWRQKALVLLELAGRRWTALDTGPGAAWMPQFGPQGRRIAFVASAAAAAAATWMRDAELRVLDLDDGSWTSLAPTPDRNVDLLAWYPTGNALLGLEYQGSTRRLVAVPLDGGPSTYLGMGDRSLRDTHVAGERIAFTAERWDEPAEVFVADLPHFAVRQISSVQSEPAAPLGRTTMVRWTSNDGTEVEGLLTYPVGDQEGQPAPLLVRLHGGPPFPAADSYIGGTFMTAYPLAAMASAGFAILQPNFRGSAGYGRRFRHGLHGEWGGQDYADVIAGVDALIDRGIADPDRLGVMGWSYGGYLSAWTITQTDRFAAASVGAGMTDLESFDATTSLGGMLDDWFGGPAEQRTQAYRQRSPISHASNVACPVLVQHGTHDPVVPVAQAVAFIAAVQRSGGVTAFRPYDGGHGPRSPCTELAVLQQNLDWFLQKLGGDDAPAGRAGSRGAADE